MPLAITCGTIFPAAKNIGVLPPLWSLPMLSWADAHLCVAEIRCAPPRTAVTVIAMQGYVPAQMAKVRCPWAGSDDLLYLDYHDKEWGTPVHDDRKLFEFLVLEGAQAGLSWSTILRKRENYRRAFAGFDPKKVAAFDKKMIKRLLADPGIVRNRLKIESAIFNAKAVLEVQKEFGSFDSYIWSFVGGAPIRNKWRSPSQIPAVTPEAKRMSADLRKRGFKFVGPTICYAYMQAVGMVNDHIVNCFRYSDIC